MTSSQSASANVRTMSSDLTEIRAGGMTCLCRPHLAGELRRVYAAGGSVFETLADLDGSLMLIGRQPLYAGAFAGASVLVKRLYHGGLLARLTADRFLTSRRFRTHIEAADFLAARGVATPETLFVSWSRRPLLVRGEIGVRYIARAVDASSHLFRPGRALPDDWRDRVAAIAALTARLHALGVAHGDLNLRNFLFTPSGDTHILDLDKAVRRPSPLAAATRRRNLARLERSIRKQGKPAPARDVETVVHAFHAAYRSVYAELRERPHRPGGSGQ